MQLRFKSDSELDTANLAAGFALLLQPGDVVLLRGELGAGKTFFVREAARALGVSGPVTSPSFTMANTYRGNIVVHHLDLYRLSAFDAQAVADFSPFFADDAITFIEWPEVAEKYLDEPSAVIEIRHAGEHSRLLLISFESDRLAQGMEGLVDSLGH